MKSSLTTHEKGIAYALKLAEQCLPIDVPVGAVIYSGQGEIIGSGWNQRELNHDSTAHAELLALREAGGSLGSWRLENATIYITLEPCPMCASAILQSRIAQIVFGAYSPIQGFTSLGLNLQAIYKVTSSIIGGILENECQDQLQQFFYTKRESGF